MYINTSEMKDTKSYDAPTTSDKKSSKTLETRFLCAQHPWVQKSKQV